jgi:hypothetical protein
MNDPRIVRGLDGLANAQDDASDFVSRKRGVLLGVALQEFTRCPLDDQVVVSVGFPCLDGTNDIGMDDAFAELGFTIESRSTLKATWPFTGCSAR